MTNASAAYENHTRLNVNGWNADPSSTMLVDQIERLSYSLHNLFLVRAFRHLAAEVLVELIRMPATHQATVSAAATANRADISPALGQLLEGCMPLLFCGPSTHQHILIQIRDLKHTGTLTPTAGSLEQLACEAVIGAF